MGSAHDDLPPHLREEYADVPEEEIRKFADKGEEYTDGFDDKPTHIPRATEIPFKDKYGNDRIRYETTYVQTEDTREKAVKLHLRTLYDHVPTKDPIYFELEKELLQVIVCPQNVARTLIATHLRRSMKHFKWIDGGDVLANYLSRGESDSISVHDGWKTIPQMYVEFGYGEARNQYLPQLIAQIMCSRERVRRHLWLFCPSDRESMTDKWKNASFDELTYIPWNEVPQLEGLEAKAGAESTAEKLHIKPRNTGNFENPGGLMSKDSKLDHLNKPDKKKPWRNE